MEYLINCKYLLFNVNSKSPDKRVCFYEGNRLIYDLVMPLDNEIPEFTFPVDVARLMGKTLRIEDADGQEVLFSTADERTDGYDGALRPQVHFTAKKGWINDPNGLVYYKGLYHMFFQHNPTDVKWGNMHWGHAVSKDMIHWEEKDIELFPDEEGTLFSGSAIVDWKNATGLKAEDEEVILLFYTCAGDTSLASKGKSFTQNLAYSTDGGLTFKRYENNPLIEQVAHENRDPKVIYYPEDDSYIMAFFLEGHEYTLYKSKDLLNWAPLQRIDMRNDWECPDFFPLAVDGDENNIKWVFIGASDRYYIGEFDGERYNYPEETKQLNFGNKSYAAQSWSDMPDGRRVRTAFANIRVPGEPYTCCMDIPQEMTIRMINGEEKLCVWPIDEVKSLVSSADELIIEKSVCEQELETGAYDIGIESPADSTFEFEVFGLKISYNAQSHMLNCNGCEAAVYGENGGLKIRIIVDTFFTELFADYGSVYMGIEHICSGNKMLLNSSKSNTVKIQLQQLENWWK